MKKNSEQNDFMGKVEQMLSSMSEEEKDAWIIAQAKLATSDVDFLKSLSGEKKIQFMPSDDEIQKFCQKIKNKEIHLKYDTYYVEFKDYEYYGDWDEAFYDPYGIGEFVDNIFLSCHKLLKLGDYAEVYKNILLLISLEIEIVETENSQDVYQGDYPFTLMELFENRLLTSDRKKVVNDLFISYYQLNKDDDNVDLANGIIKLLSLPLSESVLPSTLFSSDEREGLFTAMRSILETNIISLAKIVNDKNFDCWKGENYKLSQQYKRYNEILNDICSNG